MPTLLECIKKTGKLLSPEDKQFLMDQLDSGASDNEALDAFLGVKTGRDFEDFFAKVTSGETGIPGISSDYKPVVLDVVKQLKTPNSELYKYNEEYNKHKGNFDQHIALSIPGYRDFQYQIGNAIVKTFKSGTMLDIGASEGTQAKTITSLSGGKIKTISLDPNKKMQESFESISNVPGATFDLSAFGMSADTEGEVAWDDIKNFDPQGQKFDIVQESMVFQFIDANRDVHVKRVAELTKDDGIAIFQEKLKNPDWDANEKQKNKFKALSFAKEDLDAKSAEVLEGMHENMVSVEDLEKQLAKNFKYFKQIWDSGNFKGYVASNNKEVLDEFVDNMGDTTSPFDTQFRINELKRYDDTDGVENGELVRPPIVDGNITLSHFSPKVNLTSIDPAYYGEGYAGAEKKRRYDEAWVNRSYYGISPGEPGGHVVEKGVGQNRFDVKIAAQYLYDFAADPDGLRPGLTVSEYERAIHRAGYVGYWVKDPQLGLSAAVFERIEVGRTLSQAASVKLRRGKETLRKYGLDPNKRYTTREVAAAMEARTREKSGVIDRNDRSPEAMKKIARWIVQEVKFEMENREDSGVGWYSEKFQEAIDVVGEAFPELKTDQDARDTFTAIIAITSDGQKVGANFDQAYGIYKNYRETGQLTSDRDHVRQDSINNNLSKLQQMIDDMGVEKTHEYLLQEKKVRDLKKIAKEKGVPFNTKYPVDLKLPMAAVVFGPKLGAFYGNLMGEHGYLTMDRWWSRTINRYRGALLTKPTRKGMDRFKILIGKPDITDDEVLVTVIDPAQAYEKRGYKTRLEEVLGRKKGKMSNEEWAKLGESHPGLYVEDTIERAANTIYKAAYVNLEDAPFNSSDRKFMIDAVNHARKSLAKSGHKMTIADIQATLWYYEKRLYHEMGAGMSMDISYQDAAQEVVDKNEPGDYLELNQSGKVVIDATPERNQIGLYSGLEKAVLEMKLPQWKGSATIGWAVYPKTGEAYAQKFDTEAEANEWVKDKPEGWHVRELTVSGAAPGKVIWEKVKKLPVKKEELDWVGLEEFLTGSDTKLTREDVAQFIRENGVKIEEVVASGKVVDTLYWSQPEILDDLSEYEHLIDDIQDNNPGMSIDEATDAAREEYLLDPNMVSETDVGGVKLFLIDSEDSGFVVRRDDAEYGDVIAETSSMNEAEIQAEGWARDQGLLGDEGDPSVARWQDYIMEGLSSNYRELKLTLPEIEGDFYNEVHFPGERNILAFLRVDDRTMDGVNDEPVDFKVSIVDRVLRIIADNGDEIYSARIKESADEAKVLRDFHAGTMDGRLNKYFTHKDYEARDGQLYRRKSSKTYFIDEFQSDWHQTGRQEGYAVGEDGWSLRRKADDLADEVKSKLEQMMEDKDVFNEKQISELRSLYLETRVRGIADIEIPSFVSDKEFIETYNRYREAEKRYHAEEYGPPDAPFKNDAWITLGLRRAIVDAVDNGYEAIGFPNSRVLMERYSYEYEKLYKNLYDGKMPSFLKKISGTRPEQFTLDGKPYSETAGVKMKVQQVEGETTWEVVDEDGINVDYGQRYPRVFATEESAHNWLLREQEKGYWIMPITDELRNKVKGEGLPLFQTDRGKIYLSDNERIIQLTKSSDLSTFLHESAHLFLDMERMYAKKYGPTEDHKTIMEWLGVDSLEDITEEMHEKWAETFEVYLREGKAPSLKLRRAFAAFSRWLKVIYRTIRDGRLSRAQLDPEITGIFDRLLATEAEIKEAAANPVYDQFFKSKEQAGMTDTQWDEYQARAARVKETAERTLDEKVVAQYMRARTADWNEEKKPIIEQEKERLRKLPVYEVTNSLTVIKDPDTGEKIAEGRFDTEKLKALFPDGKIPGRFIGKHVKEGGIDPALYAEEYGFASAKAMIDEIMSSPTLKEAAEAAAEQKMVDKYGDILNDGTLEQELREALVNEDQAAMLMMEINARRKGRSGINREYLKSQAATIIGTMKYSDIKPDRYYRAMIKAAKEAVTAEDPTNAKIQELSNHYLYKEALKVKEKMRQNRRIIRSAQTRKYDAKKVDPSYIQQIKMLSEMYEMRKSPAQLAKLEDILNFYTAQISEVGGSLTDLSLLDPNLIRAMEYRQKRNGLLAGFELIQFDDMTAEDLQGVVDMSRHLRYVGGQIAEMNGDEAIRDRMELAESIRENGGKDYRLQRGKQRQGESARRRWNHLVNTLPSLANMIRKLDGFKSGGVAFNKIYTLLSDAIDIKLSMNKKFYDRFEELMGDISKVELSRLDSQHFTLESGEDVSFSSEERFMIALYWGTESSREAIMESWGMTVNDVQRIMSTLTDDQLHLVNTVWQMNESHWPDLRDASIEMTGVAPPKLEAKPFEVNGIQMTGGHMQLFYDSQRIELGNEQESARKTSSIMPNKAGSMNARVGSGGMPVLLDIGNISRSVDDKIHYIAFARAGRKLRALLNNDQVKGAIERKHGPGFYKAFIESIEGVTGGRLAQESHEEMGRISRWMRQSATLMHLGYSIRNTAQQFGAIPIAAKEVGSVKFIQASARFLGQREDLVAMINEKSKFMENRAQVVNRESREFLKQLISTSKYGHKWNKFKSHAFMFQTAVDSTVAYPTWLAAYENAMEAHGDEKRARIEADTAVAESVGSGSDIHLGRVMQSNQNEMVKTITVFGSWFNAYYQRLYRSSKGGTTYLNKEMFIDAVFLPFIVANISQLLIMDTPDSDEDWMDYLFKNTAMFLLGTIPVIREIGSFVDGFTPSTPINQLPASSVRAYNEVKAYLEGRQTGMKAVSDVGKAVTGIVPAPGSGEVWRVIDYLDSFMQGREGRVFNPYQALVEGADKDK